MRVLVAIPWRITPDRARACELTVDRYNKVLPDAEVMLFGSEHEEFCLAACRNNGVYYAERAGFDVVVIGDADTLPEQPALIRAIHQAWDPDGGRVRVQLPYTEYRSLRRRGTEQYVNGTPLRECDHLVVPAATSGVYVTSPAAWWACGGQDERFRGWGMEDVAWLVAHRTLLEAEPVRHDGRVYALHHESAAKSGPQYDANVALYQRYLAAAGNADAIRALVDEGRPAYS